MRVTLSQSQGGRDTPVLRVIIDALGAQLTLRSFDLCIDAFLGAVCLQHLEFSRERLLLSALSCTQFLRCSCCYTLCSEKKHPLRVSFIAS